MTIRAGSIGTDPSAGRYLLMDVTFGKERRMAYATEQEATSAYNRDLPIWGNPAQPRNFGASIRPSVFAKANGCDAASDAFDAPTECTPGVGLLAQILPLRIRGSQVITPDKLKLEYVVILDSAEAVLGSHEGKPAWVAKAGSLSGRPRQNGRNTAKVL